MSNKPPAGIVSMPREVLHLLLELPGEADMQTLRAAGDAGGGALLGAFSEWASERGVHDMASLPVESFRDLVCGFFEWCGWGIISVSTRSDTLIEVSITDCWEAQRWEGAPSGCHLTTGLLHGFFAGIAGYELGVMELECAGLGSGRACRFVIGTPEMVDCIYADLSAGAAYDEIVSSPS